ncbi:MAG TPA: inositol monophosphatase family protein [Anaerolineales bacterium]|nr:inositol monophosphatase family protein [Anaerolineales bacterium]
MTSLPAFGRLSREMTFMLQALGAASSVLRRVGRDIARLEKSDRTPVTIADLAVQAVLTGLLQRAFPEDVLVAEESGELLRRPEAARLLTEVVAAARDVLPEADPAQVLAWLDRGAGGTANRFWTLDPVDGTKGLLRGGQYAAALALIEEGGVALGGLACPRYPDTATGGSFAVAARGAGAWAASSLDGGWTRLAVSDETEPARCRLLRSVESGRATDERLAEVRRALGTTAPEVRMDSQVKYLALAGGEGDLIVRLLRRPGALASMPASAVRENIWDHASGVLLVEEAGGRCTDVLGRDLDFWTARQMESNLGVLASNGALHEAALEALRSTAPAGSVERTADGAA